MYPLLQEQQESGLCTICMQQSVTAQVHAVDCEIFLCWQVLPYFHIYHGAEGRVAAFSCTVSKFQRMRDALEEFYTPICSLEQNPGLPEFPDIIPHPTEVTRLTGVAGVPVADAVLARAGAVHAAMV